MSEWNSLSEPQLGSDRIFTNPTAQALYDNPIAIANRAASATSAGRWQNVGAIHVFTSSGTWTWPDGVFRAKVTLVGGGANGSGGSANTGGAGGGAGGVAIKYVHRTSDTVAVTVGGVGGTTRWGTEFSATGSPGGGSGAGQMGGIGEGGQINIAGGPGGAGGGDSGPTSFSGVGGSNSFGGGGRGRGPGDNGNGVAGRGYGAGGGGGRGSGTSGGAGTGGVCIVEY